MLVNLLYLDPAAKIGAPRHNHFGDGDNRGGRRMVHHQMEKD